MSHSARVQVVMAAALAVTLATASPAPAQYFGRNQVQYSTFDFEVLTTDHFEIYFYDEERDAALDLARMAERWYVRLSRLLQHELSSIQPIIVYASSPDFRQTNVVAGISEGTGGVTEAYKRRVVMPVFGTLQETDHVLGHELVHAFQYDIARADGSNMNSGLWRLPLWFIEGLAEYLSIGHVDPHTAMWIRDAIREDADLPSIGQLDDPRYFPYRWGQAFWSYVTGRWGDGVIRSMLDEALYAGSAAAAIEEVLGLEVDEFSDDWHRAIVAHHGPILEAGMRASEAARPLDRETPREGGLAVSPVLSPDGTRVAYLSERDMLSIDLYLADAETGRVIRRLVNTSIDPHFSSIQFLASAGTFHPSGRQFAFGAIRQGRPVLALVNTDTGNRIRDIPFPDLGEILNPSWSPDGRAIVFSATTAGRSDLFVYDLEQDTRRQLTDDAFADLQPAWSPDGTRLAFVTDRYSTQLATLDAGRLGLALLDLSTGQVRELPTFEWGKSINPQWAPDGRTLYFLADAAGTTNIHLVEVDGGGIRRLTNLDAGVSGITALSPALSTSLDANRLAFSAYEGGRVGIYIVEGRDALAGVPAEPPPPMPAAAVLPPAAREPGDVLALLNDAVLGLPETGGETEPYRARLSLDAIGRPYITAGTGRFAGGIGGGISFGMSDMLGNHNLSAALDVSTYGGFSEIYRNTGAILAYQNLTRRWNWGVSGGQIPYVTGGYGTGLDVVDGQLALVEREVIYRQVSRGVDGRVSYPFSTARRMEFGLGFQQISFDRQIRTIVTAVQTGQRLSRDTERMDIAGALNIGSAAVATVYDTSIFGATSPISGQRSRFEFAPAVGSLSFATATADYRRYFMPARFYTVATRLMHYGRYGRDSEHPALTPLFIGYPELVRGYDLGSYRPEECSADTCEIFDRLLGSRMLVANLELRFPLLRPFGVRSGMYGPVPIEVALFTDAGMAWSRGDGPAILGDDRRPVASSGVSFRVNAFGYAIAQLDFAHPFHRPARGWLWSFSLTPGF